MTPDTPPPGAADLVGNAGPLPAVTAGGVTYALARPDPGIVAAVENRLLDSAYEPVDAAMERATTDAQRQRIQKQIDQLNARYFDRGEHKCGQPEWDKAFAGPRGLVLIVWACIARHRPGFTEGDAARLAAAHPTQWARAVAHVMAPFAAAVGEHLGGDRAKVQKLVEQGMREGMPKVAEALAAAEAAGPPPT